MGMLSHISPSLMSYIRLLRQHLALLPHTPRVSLAGSRRRLVKGWLGLYL